MRASYQPRRASSRRLESPFSWGFLGVLLLALELLLPMCSATDGCGDPPKFQTMKPKISSGTIISPGFPLQYVCCPGFKPIVPLNSLFIVCQDDGTWASDLEEGCTIMSCSKLQEPPNGKLVYYNGTTQFGSQVQYVCTEGYYVLGTKILKCEANETEVIWSGDPPTCEKIFCQPPLHIPNGHFTNSHKRIFEYNETVSYSCKTSTATDHYTLVGERTLICIGPNKWSSKPPVCKAKDACGEAPRYQTMKPKFGFGVIHTTGGTVEYVCCPGFKPIVPLNSLFTVCQDDGTWAPALQEGCTIMSCSKLQEPPNGKLVYYNGTTQFGSQVQYVCTDGYYVLGTKILKCEANETEVIWSGDPPTCEKIFCQPPLHIPNGHFTNSHKRIFEYNETVSYSCKTSTATDHYTLVGERTLICIGPNKWNIEPPVCKAKDACGEAPRYQTMKPKFGFGVIHTTGGTVEYVCCPGFKPIVPLNSLFTVCQDDGTWAPALQEGCTIMSCSKLQEPPNGKLVYYNGTTQFGSQVQYVCTDGYYVLGTKILKCEANETEVIWSGNPPTCEKIFCQPPLHIPNGLFTNSHKRIFEYNETVSYSCKTSTATDHYTLVGERTLICIGPNKWSSKPPVCKATYTPIDGPKTSADDLDGGLIAVIVLTVLGVAVVGTCV
ncbi:complement receptor type 1-like [Eptesicus fuscus]|uniref:complement receptor type 1-like n=1 Tax=Eptesicus fuscus TaxID=29078 RepID=UPI002404143B|nr:complement receptor type 1-like [Eptesicus fuscus]